jgi:hypothetical protein
MASVQFWLDAKHSHSPQQNYVQLYCSLCDVSLTIVMLLFSIVTVYFFLFAVISAVLSTAISFFLLLLFLSFQIYSFFPSFLLCSFPLVFTFQNYVQENNE